MAQTVRATDVFEFTSPVRLHFERGVIDRMGKLAGPAERVLVVTGRSSVRRSGLLDRVTTALGGREVTVFDRVEPNPSIETCQAGADLARRARADLVVGLGGGSAIDAAKVIAALAPNGDFRELLGKSDYQHPPPRLWAVPTTCGTGSEVNQYAIITDAQAGDKVNFNSRHTYPELALLDPTVLDALPREVLVGTALDAFTHAFEGYTSRRSQPLAGAVAMEAVAIILRDLPAAAHGNADAKAGLLLAASMAGIVIAHCGTTVLHALGYFLTLRHDVPHGSANAALIPLLLDYLQGPAGDKVQAVLDLLPPGRRSIEGMRDYLADLGVPRGLSALGAAADEFDAWADYTIAKRNTAATVGALDKAALLALLRKYA